MGDLTAKQRCILYEGATSHPLADILNGRDHGNWWRFDPDDHSDPSEDATRYAGLADTAADPATALYLVITTQEARDRGLVRLPFLDRS
jgi:hypothetical protein